ncbi:RHS repeat-associated core domain-containing protein [Pseudomonas sp. WJP1]|uniref:RHS repeat-associated core domain-containing protein n=1 Tax=Pseudomonas sp. WJP1 TaxID=2986947 RepID=UPI002348F584|nr:RHS repeat-associated core domain-containing protein [Pseudomonas sp. WJP1]WCM51497.1 RHS repeat-associated core domain-containing protein [Pseudomonas sp. WJP1]
MISNTRDVICRYHYDALDRLVGTKTANDEELRRFYCRKHLITEIQGVVKRSIFQQNDFLLAQKNKTVGADQTSLILTDQMRSVLQAVNGGPSVPIVYSPYGHRSDEVAMLSLLGFNGERADPITGYYFLGNGYRAFNPMLMRFNSSDSASPFGKGGLNSYAYCSGDPVNRFDENGHNFLRKLFGLQSKPKTYKIVHPKPLVKLYHENFESTRHLAPEEVIRRVQDAKGIDYLSAGDKAKFVFTKNRELILGKIPKYNQDWHGIHYVHHGSLVANERSSKVLAAGYLYVDEGGGIAISNKSGHYKPDFESIYMVRDYIEDNGIAKEVKLISWNKKDDL